MKKLFLSIMAVTMIAMVSCNSDDNLYENVSTKEIATVNNLSCSKEQEAEIFLLAAKVKECNNYYFYDNSLTRGTVDPGDANKDKEKMSFWKKNKKWIKIAGTDILSLLRSGNLLEAAAASLEAALEDFLENDDNNTNNEGNSNPGGTPPVNNLLKPSVYISINQEYTNQFNTIFSNVVLTDCSSMTVTAPDSIGYYHNKVIFDLIQDEYDLNTYYKMNSSQRASFFYNHCNNYSYFQNYDSSTTIADILESIETANAIGNIMDAATTADEAYSNLVSNGILSESYLAVFTEMMNGFSQIDAETDEGDYAQALINIINNSQLDNQLKIVFKSGVMIAQGSTHLWKKMEPTTIDPVSPPMP